MSSYATQGGTHRFELIERFIEIRILPWPSFRPNFWDFLPQNWKNVLLGEQRPQIRVFFSVAGKNFTKSFHILLVKVMNVPENSHQLVHFRKRDWWLLPFRPRRATSQFGQNAIWARDEAKIMNWKKLITFWYTCAKPFSLRNNERKLFLVPNSSGPLLVGLPLNQCEERDT